MVIAFWIIVGVAALAFFGAGLMKLARSRAALAESGMGWVDDFGDGSVKLIAAAEVVGAIGLVVPPLTGTAVVLSPIAGLALAALMVGAVVVHVRRREPVIPPLALAVLVAAAAILGFLVLL